MIIRPQHAVAWRPHRGFTLLELLVAMFIAAVIFAMGYGAINQAVKTRIALQEQQAKLLELQNGMRIMEQDFVQLAPRPIRQPVGTGFQQALMSNTSGSAGTSTTSSAFSSSSTSSSSGSSFGSSSSGSSGSSSNGSPNSSNSSTSASTSPSSSNSSSSSGFSPNSTGTPLVALTRAGWTNPNGLQRPELQRVAYYFEKGTLRREYWTVLDPTQTSVTVKRDLLTHLKSVSLRYMDMSKNWQPQWPPVTNTQGVNTFRTRPIAVEITLETEDWGKIVRIIEIAV
jgi:type II secretion system protein J